MARSLKSGRYKPFIVVEILLLEFGLSGEAEMIHGLIEPAICR